MNLKEQTKQLWATCFSDSEEFMDLYFSRRYTDRINRYIETQGRLVAALQVIPYTMTFGQDVPIGYISGACTHPDVRNQGYMTKLLKDVHRRMYDEGVWFSTLIPAEEWLKGYYRKSGYEACFHYFPYNYGNVSNSSHLRVSEIGFSDDVYSFFDDMMHKRQCCIMHSKADLDIVLQDLTLAGGGLYSIYNNGNISALAFCIVDGTTLNIKEILMDEGLTLNDVLDALMQETSTTKVVSLLPTISDAYPLGMARVINVDLALERYVQLNPQVNLCINVVEDNAIPGNNGCRIISDGECVRVNGTPAKAVRVNITELTRLILEPLHPYMSLMMN